MAGTNTRDIGTFPNLSCNMIHPSTHPGTVTGNGPYDGIRVRPCSRNHAMLNRRAERTYSFTLPLEIEPSRELSLDLTLDLTLTLTLTLTRPGTGSWILRISLLLAPFVVLLLINALA